jgi:hypothetical protein
VNTYIPTCTRTYIHISYARARTHAHTRTHTQATHRHLYTTKSEINSRSDIPVSPGVRFASKQCCRRFVTQGSATSCIQRFARGLRTACVFCFQQQTKPCMFFKRCMCTPRAVGSHPGHGFRTRVGEVQRASVCSALQYLTGKVTITTLAINENNAGREKCRNSGRQTEVEAGRKDGGNTDRQKQ